MAFLEARHRAHARVEDRVRTGKDTGLDHSRRSAWRSSAWCVAAMIATDLLSWFRILCLDGALARAEPKTLRYGCCTPPPGSSAANARRVSRRASPAGRAPPSIPSPVAAAEPSAQERRD